MRAGFSWSPRLAWTALLAACAAAASGAIRAAELSRLHDLSSQSAARAIALGEQIDSLSPFDEPKLETLKEDCRRFESLLGPGDSWSRLTAIFGDRWFVETSARDVRDGFTAIVGTLRMKKAVPGDWGEILGAVDRVRKLPGASVDSVELRVGGAGDPRAFGIVRIGVSVRVTNG